MLSQDLVGNGPAADTAAAAGSTLACIGHGNYLWQMVRSRGVRWAYAIAALVTTALSVLWFGSVTYTCPDSDGSADYVCDGQGGTEMVLRTIVAVIGFGFAGWLLSRAVRRTTPRDG